MFFIVSKVAWALLKPLSLLAVLFAAGLLVSMKKPKAGVRIIAFSALLFLALGVLPAGHNMMVYLETRFERPRTLPVDVEGIIVLGGAVNGALSHHHQYPVTYGTAERLHEFVRLSRRYPYADQVVSGGSGHLGQPGAIEAPYARRLLEDMGVRVEWVEFEERSRNTYENAVFSAQQVLPQAGERWILITSASHMRRAVAVFESIGWEVIPYPTDHTTDGRYRFYPQTDIGQSFAHLETALKEFVGYGVYRLTGKIALPKEREALSLAP